MIGYEFEFFVIDKQINRPINGRQFDQIHQKLAESGWTNKIDPVSGGINYSTKGEIALKTDVVLQIFELNMPPCKTIQLADMEFRQITNEIKKVIENAGCKILMIGGFPKRIDYCERTRGNDAIAYDVQLKETVSDWYVIAGNHIWLDVEKEKIIQTTNAFHCLSGVLIAIFGNSSIIEGKIQPNLEQRNIVPERAIKYGFTFGIPKKRYKTFYQYLDLLINSNFYFLVNAEGICFYPEKKITYKEYFDGKNEVYCVDGHRGTEEAKIEYIEDLARRNFPEMRPKFKFKKGTTIEKFLKAFEKKDNEKILGMIEKTFLEIRTVPCQRYDRISLAPAFVLGLQANLDKVIEYLDKKPYGYWAEFRQKAIQKGLDFELDRSSAVEIATDMLTLSLDGLLERKFGEEKYLEGIYEFIKNGQNPGQENLEIFKHYKVEKLIENNCIK